MQTQVIKNLDLDAAVKSLQNGNPIVFPTETVYGLAAPVFQEQAIRKVFKIKGRPSDNPLIVHISSLEMLDLLTDDLTEDFHLLAKKFWPGPLTIVVKRKQQVPDIVSGDLPTVAIRMPSHKTALELIEKLGQPLVAPSANISGKPSPTLLSDCLEDLDGKVPYAIDGGACEIGIESTVVSLFHEVPTILRPGKITKEMLEEVLKKAVRGSSPEGPAYSPGMKYRHYAPKAQVRLIYSESELCEGCIRPTPQNLYAELREADRRGAVEVILYCDEKVRADAGLMNRILRASGQIG